MVNKTRAEVEKKIVEMVKASRGKIAGKKTWRKPVTVTGGSTTPGLG